MLKKNINKKGFDLAASGRNEALRGPIGTVKKSLKNSQLRKDGNN